ncbi:NUDIX hydrolase [Cohnella cellulosilytica]|uniref:NUDIX hydrolase n=1 Tax=Cohnella cellulosilytica TaxID=986710 RepID=A0ABW2FB13_9BACL
MNEVSRHASRGVLINDDGQVAMMRMAAANLYKLPGGGLEKDEDKEEAFIREIREETGYSAVIIHAIGYIDEHKVKNQFMQRSYCYIAKATSRQGDVALTEDELQLGMLAEWMSLEEATVQLQELLRYCKDYSTKFMLLRDLTILELAAQWLDESGDLNDE